jgi:PAS domain S-box-containing protein
MPKVRHFPLARYGVAVTVVALMAFVKLILDPLSNQEFTPFLLFFGAVMVSALFGGFRAGIITTLLAAMVSMYLFFPPVGSIWPQDAGQGLRLLIFVIEGLSICWIVDLLRSARRRSEESFVRLRESEERFRNSFEYAPIGMALVDLENGRWQKVNRLLCDILGYTQDELLSKTFQELTHPDDVEKDLGLTRRLVAGEIPYFQVEKRYVRKDGGVVWCLVSRSLVRDAGGEVLHGISQVEDITQRKLAEEALAQSENRLRTILETEPECVKVLDTNGCLLEMNPAGLALVEADSLEQVRGKPVYDVVVPENRADYVALTRRVLRGESGTLEFESVGLQGTRRWLETHAVPLRDARGEISGLLGITRDVTERKKAEQALRQSERLWRSVIEQAHENICLVDAHTGRILEFNPAFRDTLGYSVEELRRITLYDIVAHDPESIERNMGTVMKHRRYFIGQRKYRRKDGTLLDFEVSASTSVREAREVFCVVAHDVTERARIQKLLEERLGLLSEVAANLALQRPMEATLDIMARSVVKASTAVACSVILTDEEAEVPHTVGSYGLPEEYTSSLQAAYQAGARSPTMEVFRLRHPSLVRDVHRLVLSDPLYSSVHHLIRETGWDPVYVVPLVSHGRALGTINFYYPSGQGPTDDEEVFLKAVADQAAVTVENAHLLSETRDKAALEERQRLARDLHDSVSQALYGIALGVETARERLEKDPKAAAEPLDYIRSLNETGLAEMRALIFELRPESLQEEGLVTALRKQLAAVQGRRHLEVEAIICEEFEAALELKEALYRIAQEALNNVAKHSRAGIVRLMMVCDRGAVTLEIADDGIGFDPEGDFRGHLGLRSMQERASKVGGTLEVVSAPGEGTRIRAQVPL